MQLCGALILVMTVSTAYGLRCFTCIAADPESCNDIKTCAVLFDRCYSLRINALNMVTKGCQSRLTCGSPAQCCEGDLCNGATLTAPSVILLLLSSFFFTLFL